MNGNPTNRSCWSQLENQNRAQCSCLRVQYCVSFRATGHRMQMPRSHISCHQPNPAMRLGCHSIPAFRAYQLTARAWSSYRSAGHRGFNRSISRLFWSSKCQACCSPDADWDRASLASDRLRKWRSRLTRVRLCQLRCPLYASLPGVGLGQ